MRHRRVVPILLIAGLLALGAACGDDDEGADTTSTATSSTTTSTSTTSTAVDVEPGRAVWPPSDGSISYDDPVEAARGFATELAGFAEPVVGEFRQGDSRSGEVEVRPRSDGPVTTVLVRQLGADDSWSVIGAATDGIRPSSPESGATVSSPVQLSGTSTAFEGTVQVSVRAPGVEEPLGTGFVTGGSMGEMGPFDSSLEFEPGDAVDGAILFATVSMEDGQVWEVAAIPVVFGSA